MKARFAPLALIAALLLAFVVIAAACGSGDDDGDSLTNGQYFERLETLAGRFDDRGTELEEGFDITSDTSDDELIELSRDFLGGGLAVLQDFIDDLDDLNPPAEVADAHNTAVDAGKAVIAALEDVVDRVDDVRSAADLEALFEDVVADSESFSEGCFALQEIADDIGISVDLQCGE